MTVNHGSVGTIQDKYDLAVVNIFAGVIISLAEELANGVKPSGLLLASGIIASRAAHVVKAVCDAGFELQEQRTQDGWQGLLLRRV